MPNVQQAVAYCRQQLDALNMREYPEDVIDQMIDFTAISLARRPINGVQLNEEEMASFRREIEFLYNIRQGDGVIIQDDYTEDEDWFTSYVNIDDQPNCDNNTQQRLKRERTFFWERYRRFLERDGFPPISLANLNTVTLNPLMNLLGNPKSENNFFKRGLVIGDVQSGKTGTYIGLIAKAADAGYKIVILLAGVIEDLRKQTQKRVEHGFIGRHSEKPENPGARGNRNRNVLVEVVGVGNDYVFNANIAHVEPISLTSADGDFHADQIVAPLNDHNIFVLVIKKDTRVLGRLIEWLRGNNIHLQTPDGKISAPLLLIDDEADNASVNTNKPHLDPTAVNKSIRELAQIFTKTTYVGFTATPFANVFIAPDREGGNIENRDLFPSDFICALEPPDNYVGATRIFATTDANGNIHIPQYNSSLSNIEDAGNTEDDGFSFYHKHDKNWDGDLPDSLSDAICCFFLFNALRDLRGDNLSPRTMMINISRFKDVHIRIKEKVANIVNNVFNAIQYHLNTDTPNNLGGNEHLERLYRVWEEQYMNDRRSIHNGEEITWDMIVPLLRSANENLQLRALYTGSRDRLDYDRYFKANRFGMRVIVIGGLTLSRGLTLEGLGVTYFYRNTHTYDVLMQMGRWFGYRRNYEDLFRIWMSPLSRQWYGKIADAIEELKRDIRHMQENRLRPVDFGVRVKKTADDLQITALTKARNAQQITEYISFTGTLLETPYVSNSNDDNLHNLNLVVNTLLQHNDIEIFGQKKVIRNVSREVISTFLRNIRISPYNTKFPVEKLVDFFSERDVLRNWDICFQEGNGRTFVPQNCQTSFNLVQRTIYTSSEERRRIAIGRRGKVGGTADGKVCIDDRLIQDAQQRAREEFERKHPNETWRNHYPSDTWFRFVQNRNPLLLIYLIDPIRPEEGSNRFIDQVVDGCAENDQPLVCFALGIPTDGRDEEHEVTYLANQVYIQNELDNMADGDPDEGGE